jgi:acetyltransferase-like isoleucine patch superfamily enzyme
MGAIRAAYQSYGLIGLFHLAIDLLATRIRFRGCRLIRRPSYIRGMKWIAFGSGFTAGRGLRIDAEGDDRTTGSLLQIGMNVHVNDYVHIGAIESVKIGNHVLIASNVFITDHDHGSYGRAGLHSDPHVAPDDRDLSSAPVVIEDNVWLGEFVAVLAGARIGKGSIIGTMSTVIGVIPPYSIAVGSPARVIKQYDFESRTWVRV